MARRSPFLHQDNGGTFLSHDRDNKPRWQLAEAWLLPRISCTTYKHIMYTPLMGKIIAHYLVPIVFAGKTRVG